jgi:hypothetical protein
MSRDIFNNPKFGPTSRFLSNDENRVLLNVLKANSEGKVKKGNNLNIFKNKSLKQILNGLVSESKLKNKVAAISTHTGIFPGPLSSPATLTMPELPRVNTSMKPITAWKNANARSRKAKKSRKTRRIQRKY